MTQQQTDFQRMLAEDTFVVVAHDPNTPRNLIGVQAIKPNGDLDATFSLDQLNGNIRLIEDDIAEDQARLSDWEAMQEKVNNTIGV